MFAGGAIERPTASLAELLFSRPLSARTAAATLACATLLSTLAFWPRSEAPVPGNNEGVADRTASEREVVATAIQPISRPLPEPPAAAAEVEAAPMHDDMQPDPPPRAAAPRKVAVEGPTRRAAPPAAVTPAHGAPKRSGEAQPVAAPEAVAAPAAALHGPAMAAVDRAAAEHPPQPGTTPLQPAAEPVAAPDPAPTAPPLLAIEKPAPQFPPEAARDGIEHGRVVARLHVAADGRIGRVDILSSTPRATFDRSVRSAVRQWRYQPPGNARTVVVEFEFRLES
jgi:protein TonB